MLSAGKEACYLATSSNSSQPIHFFKDVQWCTHPYRFRVIQHWLPKKGSNYVALESAVVTETSNGRQEISEKHEP